MNGMQFTPQDWGQLALMGGLSILGNNNGNRSVGQLIGQGGLDALAGLQARKQYEAAMERQRQEDERGQQMHDLRMRQGNAELAAQAQKANLQRRFAQGDRSDEVLYGLFPEKMMARDLQIQQEKRAAKQAEIDAQRKAEEEAKFWSQFGILPGSLPVKATLSTPNPNTPSAPAPEATPVAPTIPTTLTPEQKTALALRGDAKSKAVLDLVEKQEKAALAQKEAQSNAAYALNAANTVEGLIGEGRGWKTTGMTGALAGKLEGTDAYSVRSNIDTLKAALSFEKLQAMRNASPTGGALGSVSDTELRLLSSTVASLDPNMSYEQFARNLSIVKSVLSDITNGTSKSIIRDKDGKFIGFRNEYDDMTGRYAWRKKMHGNSEREGEANSLEEIWGPR